MTKLRFVLIVGLLLLGVMCLPAAADTVTFSLTNFGGSGGNAACGTSCGTVTITQIDANTVEISVVLAPNTSFFVDTGSHNAFDFNISTNPTISLTSTLPTGFSLISGTAGTIGDDGAGIFDYAISCPTCSGNGSGPTLNSLDFTITSSGGLSIFSFAPNSGDCSTPGNCEANTVAADLIIGGVGGPTGVAWDGGPVTAPVPEPATLALFGTGLAGIAGIVRRRMKK